MIAQISQMNMITPLLLVLLCALLAMLYEQRRRRMKDQSHIQAAAADFNEQHTILKAMSDIYYSVHVIDLRDMSVVEYNGKNEVHQIVSLQQDAITTMRQVMQATMTDEYLSYALEFTDLTTLADRMQKKQFTYTELLGKHVGWIQLTFITLEADADGKPVRVICTTHVIEEEKRREQALIYKSNTDELTGFLNRRAYEEALEELRDNNMREHLVYIAADVNALKVTNDTLGHEAGDELLRGAAAVMRQCYGSYGKVYRIGGDEFVGLIYADKTQLDRIRADFSEAVDKWKGNLVESMAISVGYASVGEFPGADVNELANIAEKRMYEAKSLYYRSMGTDRRGQMAAHIALCASYTKILKVNLTKDTYQIVNMDAAEQTEAKGFAPTISGWLEGFARSGYVHEEDVANFLELTNLEHMREHFRNNRVSLGVLYRRRFDDKGRTLWKEVFMELIPSEDYSDEDQNLYLYVKCLEK